MFNKSEIMKKAWQNFRSGYFGTFSEALKAAWYDAKTITGKEIKKDDVIEMEFGDSGNWVTCTVLSVGNAKFAGYYVVTAVAKYSKREFTACVRANERVFKLAA